MCLSQIKFVVCMFCKWITSFLNCWIEQTEQDHTFIKSIDISRKKHQTNRIWFILGAFHELLGL